MTEVLNESRADQLRALLEVIAEAIDEGPGARDLASLAKQYRECLAELEAIEGANSNDDEIGEILSQRESHGEPGAVRPNRAKV